MAQYKFPLQKLLDMRLEKEEQSKREFMEAQRQKLLEEERLAGLHRDYQKHNVENPGDDLIKRRIKENYLSFMKTKISASKKELAKRNAELEEKRLLMLERQVERKTVETLKEKRTDAFNKEQEDLERKANDEFALYAYIRNTERR